MAIKANAVIAQSGGPTTVINASACGVIQQAAKSGKTGTVYGALNGILGVLKEELFDISAEKPRTIEMLRQTPAAAIGSCRYKLKDINKSKADYERILEVFKAHDIHYFFYAGGNDSMDTADKVNKLAAEQGYELVSIGVPKTIDNDLAFTDHCPGYGSVAKYVATCAMEAGRDTEALYTTDTCTILEVMGIKARFNKLGTNQRCAMHFASLTDIDEAYMCGQAAVDAALSGVNGKMITLVRQSNVPYKCTTGLANLSDVANGEKKVPTSFISKAGNHITDAMKDYVRPLVQGQAPVTIGDDGLPVFMRFEKKWPKKNCRNTFRGKDYDRYVLSAG